MKLFSSSPIEDFQKISLENLKIIQQQCIDLRIDHDKMRKELRTLVKGMSLLVSQPEADLEDMTPDTIPELEDK